jgi:hypothetical protein
MNEPAAGFTALTRSMVSVTEPEVTFDCAGLTVQIPTSEVAAKPTCGSAAAKTNAARVEETVRPAAVVQVLRVTGFLHR